ncbi:MAG: hypothetical protein HC869_25390, partial [Rhodospirillales bacterium]|nr:hypothetical protein [Rhodospirillales bacterium]
MSWSQTELDALHRAYASGTLRVTYNGKTVEYGSADDLLKRIQTIESAIQALAPFVAVVLSRVLLGEIATRRTYVATAVAVAGVAVMVGDPGSISGVGLAASLL